MKKIKKIRVFLNKTHRFGVLTISVPPVGGEGESAFGQYVGGTEFHR